MGTHILTPWPGMAEIIGSTGEVDYIQFIAEYAPFDLFTLENIASRCDNVGISSVIKIDQEPRKFLAQRGLGSGMQGVLFADVRSVEDAEECVAAVKMETPKLRGNHGCHGRRSVGYIVEGGTKAYMDSTDEAVIMFMIEKKPALDNLKEILSVKGIDMVTFGPCDYSISIGLPFSPNHPKVKEAELKVFKTAIDMGIRPRAELQWGWTDKQLQKYLDLGVIDFCNGLDVDLVYNWIKDNMPPVRKSILKKINKS